MNPYIVVPCPETHEALVCHTRKLAEETAEVLEANTREHLAEELADCLIVLAHMAESAGVDWYSVLLAARAKTEVNRRRRWRQLPDGRWKHDKGPDCRCGGEGCGPIVTQVPQ